MNVLLQDFRYALRGLRRSPAFAAAAIATLALGIGANAAIFALVDRVMLRLLPVRAPRELVLLRSPGPRQGHTWSDGDDAFSFSYPMYRDLRDRNEVFEGLLGVFPFAASVAAGGTTERAAGELVTGNYFGVLGVPPELGRVFSPDDDRAPGAHPLTVLSHGYWVRRFGSDPSILNKTIVVNGQSLTVVGIAHAAFAGVQPGRRADLFVPLAMKASMTPFQETLESPKDYWLQLIGRLKPGLSPATAEASLSATYRPLLEALLPQMTNWDDTRKKEFLARRIELPAGGVGRSNMRQGFGTPLLSLMGMVGLVLLIACSNLAGLLAARGVARQREYGIRLAIGANPGQLLRQSVVECLTFSVAGGALGLALAAWTLSALLSAFPPDADLRQVAVSIDPRVIAFTALLAVVAGILFGVGPAYRASRLDPARTLSGQSRGASSAGREAIRTRGWLVTAQVALTLVLLVAAGLFTKSLANLGRVDLGIKPDNVLAFSLAPDANGYTPERTAVLVRRLSETLGASPGVRTVSAAEVASMTGSDQTSNVRTSGLENEQTKGIRVWLNEVGPRYFSTLGIPLVAGREFRFEDDLRTGPVAIVNETMAHKFFPGRSAIGERLGIGRGDGAPNVEIVGVVRDAKAGRVGEEDHPFAFTPYLQDANLGSLTFYLRGELPPDRLAPAARAAVAALDPQLPVFDVKTLSAQIRESLLTERLIFVLSVAFGGLAALLAAIGIYGVLAFSVAERRREIGVRMALGADPATVRRLVLSEVGRFLLIGAAVGLPAAWALARIIESILFGVKAADPVVFASGLALMAAVALVAGYLPARRAAKIDPLDALRGD